MKTQYLIPADVNRLLRAAYDNDRRIWMACSLAFWQGCRISQLLGIRAKDVYTLGGRTLVFVDAKKWGYSDTHPLHCSPVRWEDQSAIHHYAKTLLPNDKLFPTLSPQYFDKCLKRIGVRAGLPESFLHAHVLRHSCGMEVWKGTHRLGAVTKMLQHRADTSALAYLRENDGLLGQDALDKLSLVAAAV